MCGCRACIVHALRGGACTVARLWCAHVVAACARGCCAPLTSPRAVVSPPCAVEPGRASVRHGAELTAVLLHAQGACAGRGVRGRLARHQRRAGTDSVDVRALPLASPRNHQPHRSRPCSLLGCVPSLRWSRYDFAASSHVELGSHDKAVKCVEYSREHRVAVTASWDKTVKCWDPRAKKEVRGRLQLEPCGTLCGPGPWPYLVPPRTALQTAKYDLPERAYTMALHDATNRLVIGTAERHVLV